MNVPEALGGLPGRLTGWAQGRYLAANSVTGISVALGVSAAGWLSGGNRAGNLYGGLALCACYLAWRAARRLAAADAEAGLARPGPDPAVLATLSGAVSSCAAYAGLAAGGRAAGMNGIWELAIAALIMMALRDLVWACRSAAAASLTAGAGPGDHLLGRAVRAVLGFSFGGRVALIAVTAPIWGAHLTLLVLLEWAVVAVGYAIVMPRPRRALASADLAHAGPDHAGPAEAGPAEAGLADAGLADAGLADAGLADAGLADADLAGTDPVGTAILDDCAGPEQEVPIIVAMPIDAVTPSPVAIPAAALSLAVPSPAVRLPAGPAATLEELLHDGPPVEPEPAAAPDPRLVAITLASRDDGWLAVRLGQVVRGQFVPLPPALAGLGATALLAWLGMRSLVGLLLLTPLVVMLLAAFGSAHPHDRGLDWLTPAVLLAGQLLYIAAVGYAFRVPVALTFALCALIGLRCASRALLSGASPVSLGEGDSQDAGQVPGDRLGWEGRMLIVGAGAMVGAPVVAYAGLAAYVAVVTGLAVLPRYVAFPARYPAIPRAPGVMARPAPRPAQAGALPAPARPALPAAGAGSSLGS
jgi:hypothetical protein